MLTVVKVELPEWWWWWRFSTTGYLGISTGGLDSRTRLDLRTKSVSNFSVKSCILLVALKQPVWNIFMKFYSKTVFDE